MAEPANVLIFHTDQQRVDSLGCCGNRYAAMAAVDRLAREGTVFERHFSTNPVCMPSRASFFTGRYSGGHGVATNGIALPRRTYVPPYEAGDLGKEVISHVPTMADVFGAAGYATRSVGKLHLTPTRSRAVSGFEESGERWREGGMADWHGPYYGFEHVEMSSGHGENAGGHYGYWLAEHYPEVAAALAKREKGKKGGAEFPEVGDLYPSLIPEEAHHSTWVGERVIEFLRGRKSGDRPFLMFAGFPDPHHPFTPPGSLADIFSAREVMPAHFREGEAASKPGAMRALMEQQPRLSAECVRRVRQYTDAMLHLVDRAVGRVCGALEELRLMENTIVVFTSDHGDYLGDHGLIRKSDLCSRALNHVPLIVRYPGAKLPARVGVPVSNADVFPSLCEWTGVAPPAGLQGRSIAAALEHPGPVMAAGHGRDRAATNFSMYDERYRFTLFPATGERELYDHREDFYELENVARRAEVREVEERLHRQLLEFHCRVDQPAIGRVSPW